MTPARTGVDSNSASAGHERCRTVPVDGLIIGLVDGATVAKGGANSAIGRSRGGQTTKIRALTDKIGRPIALLITPGNTHDLVGARELIEMVSSPKRLLADRAHDANSLSAELDQRGIKAVIPPNPTRKHPHR